MAWLIIVQCCCTRTLHFCATHIEVSLWWGSFVTAVAQWIGNFQEQRICRKFCFNLEKTAFENYKTFKKTIHHIMTRTQTNEWHSHFKSGQTSVVASFGLPIVTACWWKQAKSASSHPQGPMAYDWSHQAFKDDVRRKQDKLCTLDWLQHHDNMPTHTALSVIQFLTEHMAAAHCPLPPPYQAPWWLHVPKHENPIQDSKI